MVHIDFGFILSIGPGGINFENAPFKFTSEYLNLMEGKDSDLYKYFKLLLFKGFNCIRKYADYFYHMLDIMRV